MYQTGGTYAHENIKHTRLDHQTQYPDCSGGGSDTDRGACRQGLAVFPLGRARRPSRYHQQRDGRTRSSTWNAPGFDSYDRCCKNVGQQGKRYGSHLHEGDNVVEVKTHHDPAFGQENDLGGAQCDRRQINDWKRVKGGRVRGAKKAHRC